MVHSVTLKHSMMIFGVDELPRLHSDFTDYIESFDIDVLDYYRFTIKTCRGDVLITHPNEYIVIGEFGEVFIIDFSTYKNIMLKE